MNHINTYLYGITMSLAFFCGTLQASIPNADTVVLKFNQNVNVFVIADEGADLEAVTKYDLNKIFGDLKYKISQEDNGTLTLSVADEYGNRYLKDTTIVVEQKINDKKKTKFHYRKRIRTHFNIDVGMNNYLQLDGTWPDEINAPYTVRPWGSWYLGLFTIFKTNITGPLYLDWGGGIDWYTFKFQNARIRMEKTDTGVLFFEDPRSSISPIKSKLSITYLNARFVPVLDFSRSRSWGRNRLWNEDVGSGFRIGFGPYIAYRIDSWSKFTWRENSNKQKSHEKSNYYISNFRYGARLQFGWKGIDMFVTYDINALYTDSQDTPDVRAFAFGFTL